MRLALLFVTGMAMTACAALLSTATSKPPAPAPAATCTYRASGALPDPRCTPGAINPEVTPENLTMTICLESWTRGIRPLMEWSEPMKLRIMADYGVTEPKAYQLDHLVPLSLGGHPTDPRNLWPLVYAGPEGAQAKDQIAAKLQRRVCSGQLSLGDAQHIIAIDWRTAR